MKELLKELAVRILRTLEDNGYEAYFVGGCVRDWLLGRTVHDIDICTNAHPGDVMRLFPDHVPTGLQHGTVSVRLDGQMFEVTTYRVEGTYEDYRRPKEVRFVSDLHLDLERRDFTINAMAMDRFDRLRDPFGGRDDLRDRLIRAVGTAERRFREDALRLLRAVRFAAQLDFSIEPVTLAAMEQTAPLLSHIAAERIREELHKIVDSAAPQKGIGLIMQTGLAGFSPLLDRLFRTSHEQAWRLVHLGTLNQKWALLMYAARFDPQEARTLCLQLRMSKREAEAIAQFVGLLAALRPDWDEPRDVEWGRLLLQAGWPVCMETDNLLQACWWKRKDRRSSRSLIAAYESMPVKSLRELAVTGRDLQAALERKPGEWIQRVLMHLLEQTALHGLPNTPEALVEEARREVARHEH